MIYQIHFTWHTYYCMVALVTLWNLGFFAITRKGKLLYFILEYFTNKKSVQHAALPAGNRKFDAQIKNALIEFVGDKRKMAVDTKMEFLKSFLQNPNTNPNEYYMITSYGSVLENIEDGKNSNKWHYLKDVDIFPHVIKDPIVVCITCMASVHGFILYVLHCVIFNHSWNPIEQIAISVPVAFLGELFWKLKLKLEKE